MRRIASKTLNPSPEDSEAHRCTNVQRNPFWPKHFTSFVVEALGLRISGSEPERARERERERKNIEIAPAFCIAQTFGIPKLDRILHGTRFPPYPQLDPLR